MDIIVKELDSSVTQQEIRATSNINVTAMRPKLYKHDSPSGSLQLELRDVNQKLIDSSSVVTIASISASTYFHGHIKFDFTTSLKKNSVYFVRLIGVAGYSFSESDYIGWENDFDHKKVATNYEPANGFSAALDLEIWGND